jgi:hypothetical protein
LFLLYINGKKQMDQIFECVVHHAGDFSSFMDPDYEGPVETLDCEPDFFSYFASCIYVGGYQSVCHGKVADQ